MMTRHLRLSVRAIPVREQCGDLAAVLPDDPRRVLVWRLSSTLVLFMGKDGQWTDDPDHVEPFDSEERAARHWLDHVVPPLCMNAQEERDRFFKWAESRSRVIQKTP